MKVLLFRSNNIFASRVNKYINYYTRKKIDYTAVGWDRKCEGVSVEHFDFFRYSAGVNIGGFRAMKNHYKWMIFVFKYLKKHPDVTVIHACDLNSSFPAAIYKKYCNKEVKLVFDSCDWFSANFGNNRFLKKIFELMEKFTCKVANELIICEPERIEQITFKLKKAPLILPNIPEIDSSLLEVNNDKYKFNNNWPTLAYFGGFSEDRFQKELLTLSKTEHFNLLIAGFGTKSIEELCYEVATQENVCYIGKVDMQTGLQMTSQADIIYAMYCKINSNNIYAAPNKFYEALFLGKPIITTKGTILEQKVIDNNIGYVIEEDINELKTLIKSLDKKDLQEKGNNAKQLWDNTYSNYVNDFFENVYSKIIK